MPVNTGPDSNNYSIPEVVLSNTFNTWKDQSNLSVYKLNKLKVYSGVSSSSVSLTTTALEGVLTAALLPTVLTGHTFSAGIRGTQAAFHTFNAAGSTLTIGSNATAITMGVLSGSATINSNVTLLGTLNVIGTMTALNSANLTIADTVISLGQTGGIGVTGSVSHYQDRGIAFHYPATELSSGASLGFFGTKVGSRNFVYLYGATQSAPNSNIYTGVTGTFEGNFLGKDFRGVCGGSFVFTDSVGYTVGFRAPPAMTPPANVIWSLPVRDGYDGQLLGTNGAGQLVWDNAEPAGSTGMIQYNDGTGIAAGFSANSNLVFTVAGGLTGTTMSATLLRATGISASGVFVTTGITYNGTIAQTRTGSTIFPVRNQYKTTAATWNGAATILNDTTGDATPTSSTTNLFRYTSAFSPGVSASSGPFVIVLPPGTTTDTQLPNYNHFVKIHISGRNRLGDQSGTGAGGMSSWECVVSGYLNTISAGYNEPKWYSCDVQCTGRTPFTIIRTGYLGGGSTLTNNASRTNAVIVLGDNTLLTEWSTWSVDRIDIGYGGNFADQTMWEGKFLTSLYTSPDLISSVAVTQGKYIIATSLTTMPVKLDVGRLQALGTQNYGGARDSGILTVGNTGNNRQINFGVSDTNSAVYIEGWIPGTGGSNLVLQPTAGGGRVGIGVAAPTVALDVAGEARSSTSTTTASNAKTLATKDYVNSQSIGSAGYVYTVHRRANAAVTGNRVSGTLYQNTTSGPISVTLVVSSREGGNVACGPTTSPPIIVDTPFDSHDGYSGRIGIHFIVPPTFYYRATWAASSTGNHIHSWCELHL